MLLYSGIPLKGIALEQEVTEQAGRALMLIGAGFLTLVLVAVAAVWFWARDWVVGLWEDEPYGGEWIDPDDLPDDFGE